MKTSFTLTFDEYLESQKHRLRKPDRSAALAALFIGSLLLCLALFGFTQFPPQTQRASLVPLILGFILVIAVPVLWIRAPRVTREQDLVPLRDQFARYLSGLHEFEATERGWKSSLGGEEDARDWQSLFCAQEHPGVFVLATKTKLYLVPKRVLESDDIEQLRSYCQQSLSEAEGIRRFTFELALRPTDYMAAMRADRVRNKRNERLVVYFTAVAFAIFFFYLAWVGRYAWPLPFFMLALASLMGTLFLESAYDYATFRGWAPGRTKYRVDVGNKGARITGPDSDHILTFNSLVKYVETGKVFLLYYSSTSFSIFPKRALTPAQGEQLRGLLKAEVVAH